MSTKAEINITPLVDVVLVLLILFMILTPVSYRGYDIIVPTIARTPIPPSFHPIFIKQERQDSVLLDEMDVTLNELGGRLSSILGGRSNKDVVFWGADGLAYGQVAKTLDLIRNSGAEKIIVLTDDQTHQQKLH